MRKGLLAATVFATLGFSQTQSVTFTYSGFPVPISPNEWNVVSVINIFVPKSLSVARVSASVQIQYSGAGDLNVYLYSAHGTRTKLLERNCGSLTNIDAAFDDAGSN